MTGTPLDRTVMHAVIRAAKAYLRRIGARLAEAGLQPGQDMLLRELWRRDGLSQTELVERLGVRPPTVTKAVRRMERDGLLERRADPSDARLSRTYLTERGRKLREPVERIWSEIEARGAEGLTAEDREHLRTLVLRTYENLAEDEGGRTPGDGHDPAPDDAGDGAEEGAPRNSDLDDSCPFCSAHPSLGANSHARAFRDAYPVAEGHALVVPERHVQSIFELSPEEQRDLWALVAEVRSRLAAETDAAAFTVGVNDGDAAGQTVEHGHVHVIPRRAGDVPDPRGGVRWVVPERAPYWADS